MTQKHNLRRLSVAAFATLTSLSLTTSLGAVPTLAQGIGGEPGATTSAKEAEAATTATATASPTATATPTATTTPTPTPTADSDLDKYYPKLAKDLFDADGDGTYTIPEPATGGQGAGTIPQGLEKYYNQKVDLTTDNCVALGYPTYEDRIGRPAECGYMIAPIDAEDASKGNIAIAVMRVRAGKLSDNGTFTPTKAQGSLMWNPGGPGGSGMTMAVAGALYEPDLAEHFDMVGFDPRGTGSSMPFSQCSSDKQIDVDREANSFGMEFDAAEKDLNDRAKRYAEDCFNNTGKLFDLGKASQEDVMKHLGTWDAVGDLDLLRAISGDKKLNYMGFSYGTRLGYVYAQKFKDNAGRMVLDGAVDPGVVDEAAIASLKKVNESSNKFMDNAEVVAGSAGDSAGAGVGSAGAGSAGAAPVDDSDFTDDQKDTIAQGAGFQNTFEQFALDCSAKGAEGKTYGELWPDAMQNDPKAGEVFHCALGDGITDTAKLTAASAALLQTLETAGGGAGLPTGQPNDNRMVTFADGRQGMFQALYSETMWLTLNQALNELKAGKTAGGLMILADQYMQRDANGHYAPMLQAFTNIRCTDSNTYGERPSMDLMRRFAEAYDQAAPFQAASISPGVYDYCDFWKFKGTLPKPEKLTKVPNILVVSTTHDSATPYDSGVKLARLIDGTLLSVSGASHTSYMSGDPAKVCTDETVNTFFTEGTVPKDGEFGQKLAEPDTATDDLGNTVTLTKRCKVETFRQSSFELSTAEVHAGEAVGYIAEHYASEAGYSIQVGGETVAMATADNGGNAAGTFTVPESVKPGTVTVSLVDANGTEVATASLTVMAPEKPKEDKPEPGGKVDPGDKGDSDTGDKGGSNNPGGNGKGGNGGSDNGQNPGGDNGSPDNNGAGQNSGNNLPRTGTNVGVGVGIALALVTAGGVVLVVARRRKLTAHTAPKH